MSLLYIWIALAITFLIVEVLTATFYGLSLALSSAIVAVYVFFASPTHMDIPQGVIFVVCSFIFALIIPKYLKSSFPDKSQGVDTYIGTVRSVKKIGDDFKISLDGVDYLIESDNEITLGDKVEVIGHKGVSMKVKKV